MIWDNLKSFFKAPFTKILILIRIPLWECIPLRNVLQLLLNELNTCSFPFRIFAFKSFIAKCLCWNEKNSLWSSLEIFANLACIFSITQSQPSASTAQFISKASRDWNISFHDVHPYQLTANMTVSSPVVCQKPSSIFYYRARHFHPTLPRRRLEAAGISIREKSSDGCLGCGAGVWGESSFPLRLLKKRLYDSLRYEELTSAPTMQTQKHWLIYFILVISVRLEFNFGGCRCLFSVEIWINFIFQVRAQICRFSRHARLGDFNEFFRCFRARINEYKLWQRSPRWSQNMLCKDQPLRSSS